jgi:malonyl-CoA/methylmalonyl-CoA synthetase
VLAPPTYAFAAGMLGAWHAGATAVPLSLHQQGAELQYTIADSGCSVVLAHPRLAERLPAGTAVQLLPDDYAPACTPPAVAAVPPVPTTGPLIIYTSGTTGRPKGVLLARDNVQAQVSTLLGAWGWSSRDRIANVLPLHHVVRAWARVAIFLYLFI